MGVDIIRKAPEETVITSFSRVVQPGRLNPRIPEGVETSLRKNLEGLFYCLRDENLPSSLRSLFLARFLFRIFMRLLWEGLSLSGDILKRLNSKEFLEQMREGFEAFPQDSFLRELSTEEWIELWQNIITSNPISSSVLPKITFVIFQYISQETEREYQIPALDFFGFFVLDEVIKEDTEIESKLLLVKEGIERALEGEREWSELKKETILRWMATFTNKWYGLSIFIARSLRITPEEVQEKRELKNLFLWELFTSFEYLKEEDIDFLSRLTGRDKKILKEVGVFFLAVEEKIREWWSKGIMPSLDPLELLKEFSVIENPRERFISFAREFPLPETCFEDLLYFPYLFSSLLQRYEDLLLLKKKWGARKIIAALEFLIKVEGSIKNTLFKKRDREEVLRGLKLVLQEDKAENWLRKYLQDIQGSPMLLDVVLDHLPLLLVNFSLDDSGKKVERFYITKALQFFSTKNLSSIDRISLIERYLGVLVEFLRDNNASIEVSEGIKKDIEYFIHLFKATTNERVKEAIVYSLGNIIFFASDIKNLAEVMLEGSFSKEEVDEILEETEKQEGWSNFYKIVAFSYMSFGRRLFQELGTRLFVRVAMEWSLDSLLLLDKYANELGISPKNVFHIPPGRLIVAIDYLEIGLDPDVFRRILSQRPTQFSNFLDVLKVLNEKGEPYPSPLEIQGFLRYKGVPFSYLAIKAYRENAEKMQQVLKEVQNIAPLIFRNDTFNQVPWDNLPFSLEDALFYLYPGATAEHLELLEEIRKDTWKDIEGLRFQPEGYFFHLRPIEHTLKAHPQIQSELNSILSAPKRNFQRVVYAILRQGGAVEKPLVYSLLRLYLRHKGITNEIALFEELSKKEFENSFKAWLREGLESIREEVRKKVLQRAKQLQKDVISLRGVSLGDLPLEEILWRIISEKVLNKQRGRSGILTQIHKIKPIPLVAYVTKNPYAFLGKATAGICTAVDVNLYNRREHFQVNFVRQDYQQCIGNLQFYLISHPENKKKKALLVRGFNPSTSFLYESGATKEIVKIMLKVSLILGQENELDVFISEPGGEEEAIGALSDREEVLEILKPLLSSLPSYPYRYNIYENSWISKVYKLSPDVLENLELSQDRV